MRTTVSARGPIDPDGEGTRTWLVTEGPALVVTPYTPVAFVVLHALVAAHASAGRS